MNISIPICFFSDCTSTPKNSSFHAYDRHSLNEKDDWSKYCLRAPNGYIFNENRFCKLIEIGGIGGKLALQIISMTEERFAVMFVCMGNIIRSPLCEGLLRTMVTDAVLVDSAAVFTDDIDSAPHEHAQRVARENGFDISGHISKLITQQDFSKFDLIVTLDRIVYNEVCRMKPKGTKSKVMMFIPKKNVTNPWCAPYLDFKTMYENELLPGMRAFVENNIPAELLVKEP